jgi:hypothetical protein
MNLDQGARSKVELAAAHEKMTPRTGTDVFAFLVDQLGIANGAIVPPVLLRGF